jgi:hypothetical protein
MRPSSSLPPRIGSLIDSPKCDQAPDGCSQCVKVNRKCPGYRDQLDLMFRNESKEVVRKAKAKEAKIKQGSLRSSATSSLVSSSAAAFVPDSGNFFEIVLREDHYFPTFRPSTFSIAPTIEERATGFFFSNFVISVRGPTRGHLDYLENIYNTDDMDDNLLSSMKAVGLAGYSHVAHAPQLIKDARQEYTKALRLTNLALRSPKDVKKDSTLLAIMILGIFETVTGCDQRSMSAWAEHVNGAAALVKLRGLEQLRTPAGRRMFIQVTSSLLISCIQRQLALPMHIIELRAEVAEYINATEPAWRVQEILIAFADFRSKTRTGVISDPQAILSKALEIDGALLELFSDVPLDWEYMTMYTDADPDIVFNKRYHVYYDYWIAQLWNAMRTIRILLNEQIREVLLQGFSSKPPLFLGPEYTAQFQISTDVLYELAADILASVPQHLGYVSKCNAQICTSNSATPANSDQKKSRFLWTDFEDLSPALPWHRDSPTDKLMIRASGGYFLLWPLFLVGSMDITTDPIRRWVIKNLEYVGRSMGIQQALVLVNVVERHEDVKVWREQQRRMSAIDMSVNAVDLPLSPDAD